MHSAALITFLIWIFCQVQRHPTAGQCPTPSYSGSMIAVEQFWPNAAKIKITAESTTAVPSGNWSVVIVLDNALPAAVKVLSTFPGLLVNISSERRHITLSTKCPDFTFPNAGSMANIIILVGFIPAGYQAHWCRARAGFIASKIDDASCVGTAIISPSSSPPTFACYNRRAACQTVGHDVVFVVDSSRTVGSSDFATFLSFMVSVTQAFNIDDQVYRFGVVQFAEWDIFESSMQTQVITALQLGLNTQKISLQAAISGIPYFSNPSALTSIEFAITKAINTDLANSPRLTDEGTKRTIVLLVESSSDSASQRPATVSLLATSITKLIAVGTRDAVASELQMLTTADSSGPYIDPSFSNLMTLVPYVVNDLIAGTLTSSGCNGTALN